MRGQLQAVEIEAEKTEMRPFCFRYAGMAGEAVVPAEDDHRCIAEVWAEVEREKRGKV